MGPRRTGTGCPRSEVVRAADVNRAFARVVNKDVRYRFVIDMASLGAIG